MTEYTSEVKQIPYSAERVFNKLSNLNNLESVRPLIEGKVKEFSFNEDSCSFNVDPVGSVCVRIVEREPNSTIKFASEKSPIEFLFWIQLKEVSVEDTRMKLTFRADIPFFLKAMVSNKIEEGIANFADMLSRMPY